MKAETSRATQQRKADRYLWYWEPPFNDPKSKHYFNREHWWKQNPEDTPHAAALYELLRRHPTVGELDGQMRHFDLEPATKHHTKRELELKGPVPLVVRLGPDPMYPVASEMVLKGYYLRPWSKLSEDERAKFQNSLKSAYPGKGRDLTKGVFDLTEAAQAWEKSEKDVGGPSFDECIADLAKAYASEGRLILAVDTDFGSKKDAEAALKQIAGTFWRYWHKPARLERSRSVDWLLVIEAFENEFAVDGDARFKLGYPPKFKKFIALFEDDEARRLRAWWQRQGRASWAADPT